LRFIRLFPWLLDVAENKYDVEEEKIYIGGAELSENMVGTDNIVDSLNFFLEESFRKIQKSQYAKNILVAKNTTATDTAEVVEPVSAKDNFSSTGEKTGNCTI